MSLPASSPSDIVVVFNSCHQRSHRLSCTSNRWIDLGAHGTQELCIKRNLNDDGLPFVKMKAADSSKSGRSAVIIGSIPNMKARRHDTNTKTIVYRIQNVAHHVHVRTFASKFKDQQEADMFLYIFNGLANESEERVRGVARSNHSPPTSINVTKSSPVTITSCSDSGVCPVCNNGGVVGTDCDNCGNIKFVLADDDASSGCSSGETTDDEERSVVLLIGKINLDGATDEETDDANEDDASDEDDNICTQDWPANHEVRYA